MGDGKISVLVLLDLSAAFDIIDHEILLHHLHNMFGFGDTALSWFQSYLENRTQTVAIHGKHSTSLWCTTEISSNIFHSLHTASIKCHKTLSIFHQMYANDTQIYKSYRPSEIVDTIKCIEQYVLNAKTWMFHNKL